MDQATLQTPVTEVKQELVATAVTAATTAPAASTTTAPKELVNGIKEDPETTAQKTIKTESDTKAAAAGVPAAKAAAATAAVVANGDSNGSLGHIKLAGSTDVVSNGISTEGNTTIPAV